MRKQFGFVIALFALVMLTACGSRVEVPPAHVGKVLSENGFQDGVKAPSTFRLPFSMMYNPKLVLAETSDKNIKETMKLFMPKDKLNLTFDVRGTFSVTSDLARVEGIFARVTPEAVAGVNDTLSISFGNVYTTYAQQVVRNVVRQVLAEYTIAQVLESREAISQELFLAVQAELATTPISVRTFGLADMQPPAMIVNAQEEAKAREIAIQRAEADRLVAIKEAEAKLEVAKKQQEVDLLEAETQVLVNKKLAEGVTQAFVVQRSLRTLETMAKSDNKVFVISSEVLENPASMVGVHGAIFGEKRR